MELQWLNDLARLAQTGNFSRAAELNNVSQSAFSRRIRALEDWVGTRLVDRSRQPVRLTPAGDQILEAGKQAISRLETAREQVLSALAQPDRYVVTFAAQHSIGWRFFPAWLQAFERTFGPIVSRLRADDLPNCVADLSKGEVDFVISYESAIAKGIADRNAFEALTIGQDSLIPVCKPNPDGTPMFAIAEPSREMVPYLKFGDQAPIGWHIEPLLRARKLAPRLVKMYENSMAGALRIRARDGLGVAWLPRSLVEPDLASGLLTPAGDETWAIDVDIRLHKRRNNDNSLIRRIWTFLRQREGIALV